MSEGESQLGFRLEQQVGEEPVEIKDPSTVRLGKNYTMLVIPPDTPDGQCEVYGHQSRSPEIAQRYNLGFSRVTGKKIITIGQSGDNDFRVPRNKANVADHQAIIQKGRNGKWCITGNERVNSFIAPTEECSAFGDWIMPGKWKSFQIQEDGKVYVRSHGATNTPSLNFPSKELEIGFSSSGGKMTVSPVAVGSNFTEREIEVAPDAVFMIGYGDVNEQFMIPIIPPPTDTVYFTQPIMQIVRKGNELFVQNHRRYDTENQPVRLGVYGDIEARAKEKPAGNSLIKIQPVQIVANPVPVKEKPIPSGVQERRSNEPKPVLYATSTSHYIRDVGGREGPNQDYALSWVPSTPKAYLSHSKDEEWTDKETENLRAGSIYIVADGVAGLENGDIASSRVSHVFVESYLKHVKETDDTREAILQALKDTNAAVYDPNNRKATTLTAVIVREGNLFVASVGDSRAYIYKDGELSRLTTDHSWLERVKRHPEQLELFRQTHDEDYPTQNMIYATVGGSEQINLPDAEMVQGPIPLRPLKGGVKLVLCTDGMWEYVPEADIKAILEEESFSTRDKVHDLKNDALERGTSDNIAVCVVEINGFETTYNSKTAIEKHNRVVRSRATGFGQKIRGLLGRR